MSKLKGGVKQTYELIREFNKTFVDEEYDAAIAANETPQYFCCRLNNGGKTYKLYKPSVAALLTARDGLERIPVPYGKVFTQA